MKLFLVGLMVVGLSAFSIRASAQEAKPNDKIDYKDCSPRAISGMGTFLPEGEYQYTFNGSGDFAPATKGAAESFNVAEGGLKQELTIKNEWSGTQPAMTFRTKYVLTKGSDGRPLSVESSFGGSNGKKSTPVYGMSGGVRLAYDGNKCFVSQAYTKLPDGTEQVTYDNALCNDVLAAAKKIGAQKLSECANAFGEIENSLKAASDRIDNEKQSLNTMGFSGMGIEQKHGMASAGSWGVLMTISGCTYMRSMYGLPVDKDTLYKQAGYPGATYNPWTAGEVDKGEVKDAK